MEKVLYPLGQISHYLSAKSFLVDSMLLVKFLTATNHYMSMYVF